MKRNREGVRRIYPIFDTYGKIHSFLSEDEEAEADFEDRLRGIWPFIVSRVLDFARSLKPRERAFYDPEDALTEIVVALAERDHKWTPERGKYITFAGVILDREFFAMRDKAKMVASPRNASCRLAEYEREAEAGTLTERRAKTAEDIRRSRSGVVDLHCAGGKDGGSCSTLDVRSEAPDKVMEKHERREALKRAVRLAIAKLTTLEAIVVTRLWGINGREPESVWFVAWSLQKDEAEIRRAKARALVKLKRHLEESGAVAA